MTVRGGLLERGGVIEAAAGLVCAVIAGQGGALFVAAEAGLGKTAVPGCGRGRVDAVGLKSGSGRGHPIEGALTGHLASGAQQNRAGSSVRARPAGGAASPERRHRHVPSA
jgi:hypothetical protein